MSYGGWWRNPNHQLIDGLSHYLQRFYPSFWWCRISQPSTGYHNYGPMRISWGQPVNLKMIELPEAPRPPGQPVCFTGNIWVCLKIVYPQTQCLVIIIPIKWLQLEVYPIFGQNHLATSSSLKDQKTQI